MKTRRTPSFYSSLIGALIALFALACAAPRTAPPSETRIGATSLGRLVVAPLNLGLRAPSELPVDGEPVWDELVQQFQQMDRPVKVIDSNDAKHLWDESFAELGDSDGKPDLAVVSQRFARGLAEHADYDLLVMPSLVLRSARVRGGTAYWDGVHRKLPLRSILPTGPIDEVALIGVRATQWSLVGRVAAVSLHVEMLTSDGRSVYQGIGGLDVIQEATLAADGSGSWELVDRKDTFVDRSSLSSGIAVAFERRLPEIAAAW